MVGAHAVALVARLDLEQNVACLGVEHAVEELAAHHDARADARANREVDHGVEALARAVRDLAQAGNVNVGVVANRNVKRVEGAQEVKVAPRRLGRLEDLPVAGGSRVHARWPKGANAQCVDVVRAKPCNHAVNAVMRPLGGNLLPLENLSLGRPHREDHLGSASLERANPCHAIPRSPGGVALRLPRETFPR